MQRRPPNRLEGRSLVALLYATLVGFTGVVGALLGTFGPENLRPVALLGVVELQPTSGGLALFGMVTVGLALGVPLALVVVVSRRVDAE